MSNSKAIIAVIVAAVLVAAVTGIVFAQISNSAPNAGSTPGYQTYGPTGGYGRMIQPVQGGYSGGFGLGRCGRLR